MRRLLVMTSLWLGACALLPKGCGACALPQTDERCFDAQWCEEDRADCILRCESAASPENAEPCAKGCDDGRCACLDACHVECP